MSALHSDIWKFSVCHWDRKPPVCCDQGLSSKWDSVRTEPGPSWRTVKAKNILPRQWVTWLWVKLPLNCPPTRAIFPLDPSSLTPHIYFCYLAAVSNYLARLCAGFLHLPTGVEVCLMPFAYLICNGQLPDLPQLISSSHSLRSPQLLLLSDPGLLLRRNSLDLEALTSLYYFFKGVFFSYDSKFCWWETTEL